MTNDLIIHTAPQGTPEWLQARKGVITGSRFKDCRDRLKTATRPRSAWITPWT